MRKQLSLVLFFAALFCPPAFGEDGLTLDQAVQTALKRNPAILLAQKNMAGATAKRLQMEALSDPTLVFRDEGLSLKNQPSGGSDKEYSLGIEQGLEFPGKRALRAEIGRYGEDQAALELERTRLLVAARVKKSYYKAVLSRRTLESLEKSSGLLDQFGENLIIKYRAGTASYSDVLRAKVEKARLQNQIIEQRKDGALAKAELNLLLGKKGDDAPTLSTDIAYIPWTKSLPVLMEESRAASPTLKLLASKRRMSEAGLRLARKSVLPDFSLGLYFPSLRGSAWGFSLGVNLPLWRTRQNGEIMEAQAADDSALINAENEELRIMTRIENAYAGVKASEEQVKIFEQRLLKDMEDELKLGLSDYQFGKLEFFNLLDLYRTYTVAQLEHLKSLYLYLISLADLEVAGEEDS
ncbi:MAG: TolC family protein [Candidatus Aminicenantales bacterium]